MTMPDDPHGKRSQPAPAHPAGLRAVEDAPIYLAPAVDVRQNRRPTLADSIPPAAPVPPSERGDVAFTLPFPVEERESVLPPPSDGPTLEEPAPVSEAPETVDWERFALRAIPDPADAPPVAALPPETHVLDVEERDAILRDLLAMGDLDAQPDRTVERSVGVRATLARTRALRFRLALLAAWNLDTVPPRPRVERGLHLDLALDTALLSLIADGAPCSLAAIGADPSKDPLAGPVAALVGVLRAMRPDLPRLALRDRATAAFARLTIGGFKASLEQLAKLAQGLPEEARVLALQVAAATAVVPRVDAVRLDALHDLERALGLRPGNVAPAILEARRAR
jgi:hypothetical protein